MRLVAGANKPKIYFFWGLTFINFGIEIPWLGVQGVSGPTATSTVFSALCSSQPMDSKGSYLFTRLPGPYTCSSLCLAVGLSSEVFPSLIPSLTALLKNKTKPFL